MKHLSFSKYIADRLDKLANKLNQYVCEHQLSPEDQELFRNKKKGEYVKKTIKCIKCDRIVYEYDPDWDDDWGYKG